MTREPARKQLCEKGVIRQNAFHNAVRKNLREQIYSGCEAAWPFCLGRLVICSYTLCFYVEHRYLFVESFAEICLVFLHTPPWWPHQNAHLVALYCNGGRAVRSHCRHHDAMYTRLM